MLQWVCNGLMCIEKSLLYDAYKDGGIDTICNIYNIYLLTAHIRYYIICVWS